MKKKTKIILSSCAGALVLAGIVVGSIALIDNSNNSIAGTIVEGSGEFDWKKTETNIPFGTVDYEQQFYSNCEGDYINNISYYLIGEDIYKICYDQWFNTFDDMEVFFVFNNGYTTSIQTSFIPLLPDKIVLDNDSIQTSRGLATITEVWVRTVD